MARCQKITTTTGAVAAALMAGGSASIFYGISATSAEAATFYIKLYWEGTGTAPATTPGGAQTATTTPVAGTTTPTMTFQVPNTGLTLTAANVEINNGGRIWYWVSKLAADSDTTVLVTGGDLITFIYD